MNHRIQAVLFDFEGTLVDFQWQLAPAEEELRRVFSAAGYEVAGSYAEQWNAAVPLAEARGQLDVLHAALAPVYDRWDADAAMRWQPRPGAVALLQALAARGVSAALISNCGRAALAHVLRRFELERLLAPVLCRDDLRLMKPEPEGIQRALAALGVDARAALFVGDSRTDVLAARAAGVPVAIISGGECDASAFVTLPPDHWVSALCEVEPLVAGVGGVWSG
jgi:HAD superfamily hydrolase (TIGR01509 family)